MPYLSLPGCNLYYETHGEGPGLIFAHGGSGNQLTFWQQIPHFQDRYTVVTFSQRGTGMSLEKPDSVGPSAFVDDVTALIEHLGFADVRLVASSMGGWLLLDYALKNPNRVKALALSSTTGSITHPKLDAILANNPAAEHRARLAKIGVLPACGERMAQEQPQLHYLYGQIGQLNVPQPMGDINARLQTLRTTPAEALQRLTMPVLCVAGAEDVLQPPDSVEVFASLIPGATFVRMPETGHSVYWERAAAYNALLDELLAQVDPHLARTKR